MTINESKLQTFMGERKVGPEMVKVGELYVFLETPTSFTVGRPNEINGSIVYMLFGVKVDLAGGTIDQVPNCSFNLESTNITVLEAKKSQYIEAIKGILKSPLELRDGKSGALDTDGVLSILDDLGIKL